MLLNSTKPFQLAPYKKIGISDESAVLLISSQKFVSCPMVVMAGSIINGNLEICKKTRSGHLFFKGRIVRSFNPEMSLESLIISFKESVGIDFIILDLGLYFLITRQEHSEVRVFMTSSKNYVDVFSGINKIFSGMEIVQNNYGTNFKKEKNFFKNDEIPTNPIETSDNKPQMGTFKVEMENSLTDEEFGKLLMKTPGLSTIKYGKVEEGSLKLIRKPLKISKEMTLSNLFQYFSKSGLDYVEIDGKIKFAGFKNGGEFVWYAEFPSLFDEEHQYIEEVVEEMRDFVANNE